MKDASMGAILKSTIPNSQCLRAALRVIIPGNAITISAVNNSSQEKIAHASEIETNFPNQAKLSNSEVLLNLIKCTCGFWYQQFMIKEMV